LELLIINQLIGSCSSSLEILGIKERNSHIGKSLVPIVVISQIEKRLLVAPWNGQVVFHPSTILVQIKESFCEAASRFFVPSLFILSARGLY